MVGGTLNIWGCITSRGIGWMCSLPEGLDGETYIKILEDELQQTRENYFPHKERFTFQHDGSSVHRCKLVEKHIKGRIPTFKWPAQSPDLNIIENLWGDLKRRIRDNYHEITNKEKLWDAIQVEWEATTTEYLKKLYLSIPHRLQAVIKAKSGPTKY